MTERTHDDGIYFITGPTSDSTYFIARTVSDTLQFYSFQTRSAARSQRWRTPGST